MIDGDMALDQMDTFMTLLKGQTIIREQEHIIPGDLDLMDTCMTL